MHLLLRRAASGLPPTSVCDPTAAPDTKLTDGVRIERREDGSMVVDLRDHQSDAASSRQDGESARDHA
jgi:hypothetical protein